MTAAPKPSELAPRLVPFFRGQQRDLPWRKDRTGYRVWVSEVMLQQTRVATVVAYYSRFLERFPDVAALAQAPLGDVLALWSGLGYYRRARALHAGAIDVVERFGGVVPATVDELKSIHGIGPYTAGAIASLAFGVRAPVVDGNVVRVFCRVFGLDDDMRKPAAHKPIWALALAALPTSGAGEMNEAVMELGATVCTPKSPSCAECPLSDICVAKATDRVALLPVLAKKQTPKLVHAAALVVRRGDKVLLARRRGDALFGGLWEPPMVEASSKAEATRELRALSPSAKIGGSIVHVLTHRTMNVTVLEAAVGLTQYPDIYDETCEVAEGELAQYGVSTLARKVLAAAPRKSPR